MKIALLSVVAAVWLVTTGDQVRLWTGGETGLWLNAVQVAPLKPRPWTNLGRQHAFRGDTHLAEDAFTTAMVLSAPRPPTERGIAFGIAQSNRDRLHIDITEWLTRIE